MRRFRALRNIFCSDGECLQRTRRRVWTCTRVKKGTRSSESCGSKSAFVQPMLALVLLGSDEQNTHTHTHADIFSEFTHTHTPASNRSVHRFMLHTLVHLLPVPSSPDRQTAVRVCQTSICQLTFITRLAPTVQVTRVFTRAGMHNLSHQLLSLHALPHLLASFLPPVWSHSWYESMRSGRDSAK